MAATVKWPTKRLGDFAEFHSGVNYNKNKFGVGIKVVGVSDFQGYTKPRYSELEQINKEGIVTERNILRDDDIVFIRSNENRELIAGILSASDELMENSQRRIRLSEARVRALYREWFVHFRFPGHEKHPHVASPLGDPPKAGRFARSVIPFGSSPGLRSSAERSRRTASIAWSQSGTCRTAQSILSPTPG